MSQVEATAFGGLLRQLRLSKGLTQSALAERAGLSERAVNDLERDPKRLPRLETVTLLADALGVSEEHRARLLAAARPTVALADARAPAQTIAAKPSETDGAPMPVMSVRFAPRGSIPVDSGPRFVGREREVREVCERLRQPEIRLLTLTGMGGIGKTRLAQRVAAALVADFADGVVYVPLAAVSEPQQVLPAIAVALAIHDAERETLERRVRERLANERVLLVLDNFEQITAAALEVESLLAACPALKALVTSRAPLRLAREQEYIVPPLSLPDMARGTSTSTLRECESVALFERCAQAMQPTFALTDANAATVAQICARLEGVPLAIQLAAARIKVLPPATLLARLGGQLAILTGGPRDLPERQRTLRATLDWSYLLLSHAQQVLFSRLAVFVDGWTLEAAESVCAGGDVDREAILDLLGHLVDQSLVVVSEPNGAARYHMLEVIYQYASEKLRESGEEQETRDRHLAWCVELAERADVGIWMAAAAADVSQMRIEGGNLLAALGWSRRKPAGESELRITGVLLGLWPLLGSVNEGRRLLREALARTDQNTRTRARGRALFALASLSAMASDFQTAEALADEAKAVLTEIGDEQMLARVRISLARVNLRQGDRDHFELRRAEILEACRAQEDPRDLIETLFMFGDYDMERGQYGAARRQLEECADLCRQLGDQWMIGIPLVSLARVYCAEGDLAHARASAEEALAIRHQFATDWNVAISLNSLGEVERCAGDFERAQALFEQARVIYHRQGDEAGVAWSRHNFGWVALHHGDLSLAAEMMRSALAIRHRHGYLQGIAACLAGMGGLATHLGQHERAARILGATDALLRELGTVLPPADLTDFACSDAMARAALPPARFDAAWEAGHALSLEDAVSEALGIDA